MLATERYDALVVGARCAGAACAMLMARRGMRVLAVDRGGYGNDTLSTHALMRGGVLQLHRWGVLPRLLETGTPAVRRVSTNSCSGPSSPTRSVTTIRRPSVRSHPRLANEPIAWFTLCRDPPAISAS